jgi:hypothetical protein
VALCPKQHVWDNLESRLGCRISVKSSPKGMGIPVVIVFVRGACARRSRYQLAWVFRDPLPSTSARKRPTIVALEWGETSRRPSGSKERQYWGRERFHSVAMRSSGRRITSNLLKMRSMSPSLRPSCRRQRLRLPATKSKLEKHSLEVEAQIGIFRLWLILLVVPCKSAFPMYSHHFKIDFNCI